MKVRNAKCEFQILEMEPAGSKFEFGNSNFRCGEFRILILDFTFRISDLRFRIWTLVIWRNHA
jgi:hypothetical protein